MKEIWLIRHAKSSWDNLTLADVERPLNKRGKRDAPVMAEFLADRYDAPQLIISSHATRARETANHFVKVYGTKGEKYKIKESLYHASPGQIIDVIHEISDDYASVMLFGHNPGFTEVISSLTIDRVDHVPTCGISHISSTADRWQEVSRANTRLVDFFYPKMFTR